MCTDLYSSSPAIYWKTSPSVVSLCLKSLGSPRFPPGEGWLLPSPHRLLFVTSWLLVPPIRGKTQKPTSFTGYTGCSLTSLSTCFVPLGFQANVPLPLLFYFQVPSLSEKNSSCLRFQPSDLSDLRRLCSVLCDTLSRSEPTPRSLMHPYLFSAGQCAT